MPEVVVEDVLDGVEIIDITDDDKATGAKKKRRSYEVSRRYRIIGQSSICWQRWFVEIETPLCIW
jgi:hypothetical protein